MTPQCALQMRSTIGSDLDAGDRFTGQWEPSCNTLLKKMMEEDEKSHMGI